MQRIDRYAELQRQAKTIEIEMRQIRAELLAGDAPLEGDRYVGRVRRHLTLRSIAEADTRPVHVTPSNGAGIRWDRLHYGD